MVTVVARSRKPRVIYPDVLNTVTFRHAWSQWNQYIARHCGTADTISRQQQQVARLVYAGHNRAVAAITNSIAMGYALVYVR